MQLINYQEQPPSEHSAAHGTLYSYPTLLTKSHREHCQCQVIAAPSTSHCSILEPPNENKTQSLGMTGTNWIGMKGKKTPFECPTGNCHAEIAPPVIFLDALSSCEHAVITQNPVFHPDVFCTSATSIFPHWTGHCPPKLLQEATAVVVFSGPSWFPANASREGPEKALLLVLQSPGSSPVHAQVLGHPSQLWSKDLFINKWGSYSWAPAASQHITPYFYSYRNTNSSADNYTAEFKLK